MKKEITDEQLIAWIEGSADEELDKRIQSDPELSKRIQEMRQLLGIIESSSELEVPAHIGLQVQEAIADEYTKKQKNGSWMQVAAAVSILVVGFGLGKFSGGNSSDELADLRTEIQSLREVTMTSALQQYSASERIMAVNQIESVKETNPELITTLINTLNGDESPNVRYAALQALSNYIDSQDVRAELVKSLESQSDPLIQISLISILVEAEERSAIAPLRDIIENEEVTPEVKQQAEIAVQVLT